MPPCYELTLTHRTFMSGAKVKLTDLKSGQEYLLMVLKMNAKGLLVTSTHPIAPGTPMQLSIQMESGGDPIDLKGMVHKIAEHPSGKKGIIVRFVSPTELHLKRITEFVETGNLLPTRKGELTEIVTRVPELSSREKTPLAGLDTLSKLKITSPSQPISDLEDVMDEEIAHSESPGFGGSTRIMDVDEVQAPLKMSRGPSKLRTASLVFVLFAGFILAIYFGLRPLLRFLDERFRLKPPSSSVLTTTVPLRMSPIPSAPVPTPFPRVAPAATPRALLTPRPTIPPTPVPTVPTTPLPSPPTATPMETSVPATPSPIPPTPIPVKRIKRVAVPVNTEISDISVESGFASVKITVAGQGDFSSYKVSQAMNPRRLVIDFKGIRNIKVRDSIPVNKNPLLRIRTQRKGLGSQVTLDLYPVDFPKYEVHPRADGAEILLQL
jgi:hypothetical protein